MTSTATRNFALTLLLPLASCTLLGRAGVDLKSPLGSKAGPSKPESSNSESSKAKPSPFKGVSKVVAPSVSDSVAEIPASLRVAAKAGAPEITLTGASWCTDEVKGIAWNKSTDSKFKNAMKYSGELGRLGLDSTQDIARFACGGTQSAARFSWVRSFMQARANALGLSEEHQVHLLAFTGRSQFSIRNYVGGGESCEAFVPKRNLNTLQSSVLVARNIGMGCRGTLPLDFMFWWMDRGPTINSTIAKLGWLRSAFENNSLAAVMAWHDAKTFDSNAYFSELADLGANDEILTRSIIVLNKVLRNIERWKQHANDTLGDDFDVLMAVADEGFNEWTKSYQADKAAVDFSFSMEEAMLEGDKRLFKGCSSKARKFASEFVMRSGPTTIEEIERAASTPIGKLLLSAAYECEKSQGTKLSMAMYAELLAKSGRSRGPRYAAAVKVAAAVAEIKRERSRFPLEARDVLPKSSARGFGDSAIVGYFKRAEGVVASAKRKGESVEVHFKKESWIVPLYKCKDTNRLDRILDDGTLVWRQSCKKTGTKVVSSQEKPVNLPASAATGIKPGAFLMASRSQGASSEGLPKRVYQSKKRQKIVNYYGLPL